MNELLHICTRAAWDEARARGVYRPASLAGEGFIHCSTLEQVLGPANAFYQGQSGLVLLVIDESQVESPVVYEDCYETGTAFPHIYGELKVESVARVVPFEPGVDGLFQLPDAL